MPLPIPAQIKAMRAEARKEATAYYNQRLNAAIKAKASWLKKVKQNERQAGGLYRLIILIHVIRFPNLQRANRCFGANRTEKKDL